MSCISSTLNSLLDKSRLFSFENVNYCLFSKSGFTKGCIERANETGNVTLTTFGEFFNC